MTSSATTWSRMSQWSDDPYLYEAVGARKPPGHPRRGARAPPRGALATAGSVTVSAPAGRSPETAAGTSAAANAAVSAPGRRSRSTPALRRDTTRAPLPAPGMGPRAGDRPRRLAEPPRPRPPAAPRPRPPLLPPRPRLLDLTLASRFMGGTAPAGGVTPTRGATVT
ncbi:unnamed protein product [Prorocentrum cordatum]|uniref:Uncharacterized protein n=1 Tax=Prorocentrum cordatum TaxID=2364126 RepID=A0ABN9WA99_9DINO|nr:unnamed protein product [Polarella glacialis]